MTLIKHRASVHFSCKKKKICFASQNYLKNNELSKIPSSSTSPALVRLKKIRFISKLLHVSVLASIGSLTVFSSPAFARRQIVLSDKKTLVNAYEHVAGLSLVTFRGSVPQSWIASFRTALGSHCGFNMDIRPKLIDIFEELSGGDLAPHARLFSSDPSSIFPSQASLASPSVSSPSPSPSPSTLLASLPLPTPSAATPSTELPLLPPSALDLKRQEDLMFQHLMNPPHKKDGGDGMARGREDKSPVLPTVAEPSFLSNHPSPLTTSFPTPLPAPSLPSLSYHPLLNPSVTTNRISLNPSDVASKKNRPAIGIPAAAADLVAMSDAWISPAVRQGLIRPLVGAREQRWFNCLPYVMRRLVCRNNQGNLDPEGDVYAAPYRWGAMLVLVRDDKLRKRRGAVAVRRWKDLLQPALKGRVAIPESPREFLAFVVRTLEDDLIEMERGKERGKERKEDKTEIGLGEKEGKTQNRNNDSGESLRTKRKRLGVNATAEELEALGITRGMMLNRAKEIRKQVKLVGEADGLRALAAGDVLACLANSDAMLPFVELSGLGAACQVVLPPGGSTLWADVWVSPMGNSCGNSLGNHREIPEDDPEDVTGFRDLGPAVKARLNKVYCNSVAGGRAALPKTTPIVPSPLVASWLEFCVRKERLNQGSVGFKSSGGAVVASLLTRGDIGQERGEGGRGEGGQRGGRGGGDEEAGKSKGKEGEGGKNENKENGLNRNSSNNNHSHNSHSTQNSSDHPSHSTCSLLNTPGFRTSTPTTAPPTTAAAASIASSDASTSLKEQAGEEEVEEEASAEMISTTEAGDEAEEEDEADEEEGDEQLENENEKEKEKEKGKEEASPSSSSLLKSHLLSIPTHPRDAKKKRKGDGEREGDQSKSIVWPAMFKKILGIQNGGLRQAKGFMPSMQRLVECEFAEPIQDEKTLKLYDDVINNFAL